MATDFVEVIFRKTGWADLEVTGTPGATYPAPVLGLGSGDQNLQAIPIAFAMLLQVFVNDAAAAAGGVSVGFCYLDSATGKLRVRVT